MLASPQGVFDLGRYGAVYDVQHDSLGRRIATASADAVIRIWCSERKSLVAELQSHQAPVLTISWAPRTAGLLASGADDGSVIVWREGKDGQWRAVHQLTVKGSVTAVSFCPPQYGLLLALAGASSGEVCIVTRREVNASPVLPSGEQWQARWFSAHGGGIVALAWAPGSSPATLAAGPAAARAAAHGPCRLVTAGFDGNVAVWRADEKLNWTLQNEVMQSSSCVQCISWRPNVGIPSNTVVIGFKDGSVQAWMQDMEGQSWNQKASWTVKGDVRRLAWSKAGWVLGISASDSDSYLYKEGPIGIWTQICSFDG